MISFLSAFVAAQLAPHEARARHPTSHAACDACSEDCIEDFGLCMAIAAFFPPAIAACTADKIKCAAKCVADDCCPKRCEFDPGDLAGGGCCDADEECVDESDPHSRSGCCPAGRAVCSGDCCPEGATCCGGACCPGGWFCENGFCTDSVPFPPPPPPPPPEPSEVDCAVPGARPCQRPSGEWLCCAPDEKCCAGWCSPTCIN